MFRFSPPAMSNTSRRLVAGLVSCLAVLTLASCGGGTQSKKFVPESFVVFGDEFSLIKPNGAKYAINTYRKDSTTTYSCNDQYLWVQVMAQNVDFKFPNECPDWLGAGTKTAVMLADDPVDVSINTVSADVAVANAGANKVLTTISNNAGLLNDKTLVTVSVGRADIVQAYLAYQASPSDATLSSLVSQLKTLGGNFAAGLSPIVRSGARMLVVLTPDLGLSPLANEDAVNGPRVLSALTKGFNDGLTFGLSIEGYVGQQVALVDTSRTLAAFVAAGTFSATVTNADVAHAACVNATSSVLPCLSDASPSQLAAIDAATTYLWADKTHLSWVFSTAVSSAAYGAFVNHPF